MPEALAHMLAEKFVAFRDRELQIETELRTYKQLLDVAPCPMMLATREGLIEYVNVSYCEMMGTSPEQVLADGWKGIVAEDDLERTERMWQHVVENRLKEFSAWSKLKTSFGTAQIFWRSAFLPTNNYAIALFHPACAFFKYPTGCGVMQCNVNLTGTVPGVVQE